MTHKWTPSTLGHGEMQCKYCFATNREIAVIGDLNHCPNAPEHTQTDTREEIARATVGPALKQSEEVYKVFSTKTDTSQTEPQDIVPSELGDDAMKWAEAFCTTMHKNNWEISDISDGLMLGWFANAIEVSTDTRQPSGYTIKPLEWVRADLIAWGETSGPYNKTCEFGTGPNGEGTFFTISYQGVVLHSGWNEAAAVNAAEKHHESRIRSYIFDTQTDTRSAALRDGMTDQYKAGWDAAIEAATGKIEIAARIAWDKEVKAERENQALIESKHRHSRYALSGVQLLIQSLSPPEPTPAPELDTHQSITHEAADAILALIPPEPTPAPERLCFVDCGKEAPECVCRATSFRSDNFKDWFKNVTMEQLQGLHDTQTDARETALREAAALARKQYEYWADSGVQCDVTACDNIADAILALIGETE